MIEFMHACVQNVNCKIFRCRPGDFALIQSKEDATIHECYVDHVQRDSVVLMIPEKAKEEWYVIFACMQTILILSALACKLKH